MNLIDHIGHTVTVWTSEGNSLAECTLITADEFGIVVQPYPGSPDENLKEVFIPWNRVKYVDLIKPKQGDGCWHYKAKMQYGKPKPLVRNEVEYAKVGDIVREIDMVFNTVVHKDLKVERSNEKYIEVSGKRDGFLYSIPHGQYRIVNRVDNKEESADKAPEPTTNELVEMLKERQHVTQIDLLKKSDRLFCTQKSDTGMLLPWVIDGPATILVIPDGDGK